MTDIRDGFTSEIKSLLVCSDGDFLAALGAAQCKNSAARGGFHARPETMGANAALVVGLKCTFHDSETPVAKKTCKINMLIIATSVEGRNVPESPKGCNPLFGVALTASPKDPPKRTQAVVRII